jgi:superfamily II DNA or RNA helicase
MSIQIKISELSEYQKNNILNDLEIISYINEEELEDEKKKKNKFKKKKPAFNLFQKPISLFAFDVDDEYIYLPFSYVYHFYDKYFTFPKKYPKFSSIQAKRKDDKEDDDGNKYNISLIPRQKDILPEAYEILNRTHSLILQCGCGFGKTYLSVFLAIKLSYITMILIHRISLIDQWIDTIKKIFPEAIIQVVESDSVIKPAHFYIMNMSTVSKRNRKDFENIGLLICDEIHVLPTKVNSKSLYYFLPKFLIGLSATPDRENDDLSQLLYTYFGMEIIKRQLIRPFNVYALYTDFIPDTKLSKTGNLDWNSVLTNIAENDHLNYIVSNIAKYFYNRNILILCKRVGECKRLKSLLKDENTDIYTAKDRKFDYNCRILITTFGKSGVGFDFPKLDMIIIASDVDTGLEQYIGRACRRDDSVPIIIHVVHKKFFPCYKHFKNGMDVYNKLGGIIKSFGLCFPEFFEKYRYEDE